jgi:hypothetical protein
MKIPLFLSFFAILTTDWFQFTPKSGDYTFEINNRALYRRKELKEGYAEIFTVSNEKHDSIIEYIISVSKLKQDKKVSLEDLSTGEYKKNYLSSCNCEVISEKTVQYKNFKGILYNVRMKKKNGYMAGESIHITKDDILYNIGFLTPENLLSKFKPEFDHSINTMQLIK